ncbi:MAG: OmpA family protein, partial [Gammaproteobacteria bacterium]
KADFQSYAHIILPWLSHEVNKYPNQVEIIGHTDGAQYHGTQYTNWELSADRANATRRVLLNNGLDSSKIVRVIGEGDHDLLDKKNVTDPANRRIEIIILSDEAMKKKIRHQ